jgi:hypothetical protein
MDEKIPVLGVFHWSTMDNCEWVLSFKMRFGLVHVDNDGPNRTFNRRLKRCGAFWHSVVQRNGFNLTDSVPDEIVDPIQAELAREKEQKSKTSTSTSTPSKKKK